MLQKLILINFQKHKKKVIEFGDRTTTLIGPTDRGKSTILRALRFLCLNPPTRKSHKSVADPHIRHGADFCKVILHTDDHKIVRAKGSCGNYYSLDGNKYSAIGNNVPPDISSVLAVQQLNFQRQLDQPFWFSETGGQISRNLNEIVNLKEMDQALANVGNKLRTARGKYQESSDRRRQLKEELQEMNWVPEFVTGIDNLATIQTSQREMSLQASLIADVIKVGTRHLANRDRLALAIGEGKKLAQLGEQAARASLASRSLSKFIQTFEQTRGAILFKSPDLSSVLKLRKEADLEMETYRGLDMLIDEIHLAELKVGAIEDNLEEQKQKLKQLQSKVKTCPTCGKPV